MPRKARIDAPGALHHIIIRGIEKRRIFEDDKGRNEFIKRLGDVLSEAETPKHIQQIFRLGKFQVQALSI